MALSDDSMRELAALAGVVLGQDDLDQTLDEICRISVRAVPAAEGASITSYSDGRPSAVAASDAWARGLDEMQYAEHEGPCLDCARTGVVFRVRDLDTDQRWPSYLPRARESGAESMLSLPMAVEGATVGALNLYARRPDAFSSGEVSVGMVLAAHAGLAGQVASAFFSHRDLGEQLRAAMASRSVIDQAKGVLMAGRRCTADEAFAALVQMSQSANRKLRDVAGAVVEQASRPGVGPVPRPGPRSASRS